MTRFRFGLTFLGAGLLLVFAGAGAAQQRSSAPVFGFVYVGQESWRLARLDPLTLLERRGPSLALGSRISAWSFSPDRSTLVLADSDLNGVFMLVDPVRMRRLGFVDTGGMAVIRTTFWPDDRRLYAVVARLNRQADGSLTPASTSLLAVDPETRSVVGEQALDSFVYGAAHSSRTLALLVGPKTGLGEAGLALVDADGAVRTVRLDGVSVGSDASGEEGPARVVHYAQPGLAISADGSRAFVVSPGQIAAVDLATLQVSYHRLAGASRALQSVEKGPLDGTSRVAMWARPGQLLVSGVDERGSIDAQGRMLYDPRPVGLQLVDTTDWSAKTIDPNAAGASVGTDAIVVTPWHWNAERQRYDGRGATIYSLAGVRRAHLFGKRQVFGIVVGRRAFIERGNASYSVVSTTTGRIVRSIRHQLPAPLLGAARDY
ncbi:MAG TPA: hypothetical protein VE596_19505 [Gaiellaceae bacterium]|jgi:hypothetical protein|nr:hypothetical protein [Gaiellaceae bacterium]